jgi:hypothetical protein
VSRYDVAAVANTNHPPHVRDELWQLFQNGSRTLARIARAAVRYQRFGTHGCAGHCFAGFPILQGRRAMPKENDLEGAQDQGGKHGGQAGVPKPPPQPVDTRRDKDAPKRSSDDR